MFIMYDQQSFILSHHQPLPSHTFVIPPKKINGKSCQFFLTFPRRSTTLSAARLVWWLKLVFAKAASAVVPAVQSAPALSLSRMLTPPWLSCYLAKRQRSTCENNLLFHALLLFQNSYSQGNEGNHSRLGCFGR